MDHQFNARSNLNPDLGCRVTISWISTTSVIGKSLYFLGKKNLHFRNAKSIDRTITSKIMFLTYPLHNLCRDGWRK